MNIGITGGKGKMGSVVVRLAKEEKNIHDIKIIEGFEELIETMGIVDVYVDCTSREAFISNAKIYLDIGRPLVIATTGFSSAEEQYIQEMAKQIPIIKSSNFSIGVYKYIKVVDFAAGLFSEYDAGIIEKHHKHKLDKPSGTAKNMINVLNDKDFSNNIDVQSQRLGEIVGEHELTFAFGSERMEINHRIYTRESFASGMLYATSWIKAQPAGNLYSMKDMLDY